MRWVRGLSILIAVVALLLEVAAVAAGGGVAGTPIFVGVALFAFGFRHPLSDTRGRRGMYRGVIGLAVALIVSAILAIAIGGPPSPLMLVLAAAYESALAWRARTAVRRHRVNLMSAYFRD